MPRFAALFLAHCISVVLCTVENEVGLVRTKRLTDTGCSVTPLTDEEDVSKGDLDSIFPQFSYDP